ncbi:tRNA lysidine(34) synthetase TilS [Azospira inquinata]|uniref:tRNA(Ile)-lysidine synthase n=1 Tax=Azospira inquinata TaxID=2785627 RepID=A0A975XUE2_9RHOO|nr:tRNA lysidine(34) synthetase TilS [Azospira inquinata]QWT45967.1 tRNA lysidine(34) synthetase TilS [Azospira inquinata]QWT48706.1 tRNA lysidine(34) synthetase TilS [Azospira inquinata]
MAASRNRICTDPALGFPARLQALLGAGFPPGGRLWVGLSGGRDSVLQLALLREAAPLLGFSLSAIHVHHGLSPRADAWADFCVRLCRDWELPLEVVRVQVAPQGGEGLEAAARRARYAAYQALDGDALALAHHQDDQAETLLLNLLRGAGVAGLAAMPPRRPLLRPGRTPLVLLRPLLDYPRAWIEDQLARRGLDWVEDESNGDARFSRNFLRRDVLPLLEQRFSARTSLARAAAWAGEAETLLEELAAEDGARGASPDFPGTLSLAALQGLSGPRRRNLLRHWLHRQGGPRPEARTLAELEAQVLAYRPDGQMAWRCGQWVARGWRGALFLEHDPLATPSLPESAPWEGEMPVPWGSGTIFSARATGQGLNAAALEAGPAQFRPRQGGESFQLAGRPHRPLKKLLQESAVPPWQRERLPLLWLGETLAWVPGIGMGAALICPPEEEGWRLTWEPGTGQTAALGAQDGGRND